MSDDPEQGWFEFDKQVEFFLERQEQIAEWASLADEAQNAARRCMATVPLSADDIGLGWIVGEFAPREQVIGRAVFRPSWCLTTLEIPDVAIAMSADGKPDPAGVWPRTSLPYVGVRCARATASGVAMKQYLTDNPLSLNLTLPPMRKGSEWPAYRFIKADRSWWKHLAAWRAVVVRDYAEVAKAYDATIEAAVASVRRP